MSNNISTVDDNTSKFITFIKSFLTDRFKVSYKENKKISNYYKKNKNNIKLPPRTKLNKHYYLLNNEDNIELCYDYDYGNCIYMLYNCINKITYNVYYIVLDYENHDSHVLINNLYNIKKYIDNMFFKIKDKDEIYDIDKLSKDIYLNVIRTKVINDNILNNINNNFTIRYIYYGNKDICIELTYDYDNKILKVFIEFVRDEYERFLSFVIDIKNDWKLYITEIIYPEFLTGEIKEINLTDKFNTKQMKDKYTNIIFTEFLDMLDEYDIKTDGFRIL